MNLLKKLTVPLCGFLFANPLLFGTPGYERGEWTRPLMGTVFHIIVYSPAGSKAEESAFKAFELIERLENTLSYYQEESELNRLARVDRKSVV